MYCRGAKGSREPCEEVILLIHGYNGVEESKQILLLIDLENLSQDNTDKNSNMLQTKDCS